MEHIVKNWILQAECDLDSAKYNLKGKRLDVAAYLCHQSVEKALKALYLKTHKELWKTHDLVKLAMLVNASDEVIAICNDINPIYLEDRYPDFSDVIPAKKFLEGDVRGFVKKVEVLVKWIKVTLNY